MKAAQWRDDGAKSLSWGVMGWLFGMEQHLHRMEEHFTVKRTWAKGVLPDAEKKGRKACKATGKRSRLSTRSWNWSSVVVT